MANQHLKEIKTLSDIFVSNNKQGIPEKQYFLKAFTNPGKKISNLC